ncbi:hypothetical protein KI387_040865, partial [Taxus chinensis]
DNKEKEEECKDEEDMELVGMFEPEHIEPLPVEKELCNEEEEHLCNLNIEEKKGLKIVEDTRNKGKTKLYDEPMHKRVEDISPLGTIKLSTIVEY